MSTSSSLCTSACPLQHPTFTSHHEFMQWTFSECISSPSFRMMMETSHRIGIRVHLWELTPAISLCHWSQPLECPDSSHPLPHPLLRSTSHQMWETLPKALLKAGETTHTALPLSAHTTDLTREERRLARQDMLLANIGLSQIPFPFSFWKSLFHCLLTTKSNSASTLPWHRIMWFSSMKKCNIDGATNHYGYQSKLLFLAKLFQPHKNMTFLPLLHCTR